MIVVDKVYEPLQAAKQTYNDRCTPLTTIPKKLQKYPNTRARKITLATNSQHIKDTQTIMEFPPLAIVWGPIS